MRINTNISALNAHRQLGANQAKGAGSLEKLSSGVRIIKAGDDAAGLAISEKMRGQIRGLKQAQRNAQDGISMIQTAEGALNETHSILQRIRELADQSANDTNINIDRDEIQKEINALTSEINRIGNTTEFNTQRLLDGGTVKSTVSADTKGVALTEGTVDFKINTESVGSTTKGEYSLEITNMFAAGEQITMDGETFTAVASGAEAANGEFDVGTSTESQAAALKKAIEANSKLNTAYDVTVKDSTISLVEKGTPSGNDLSLNKVGNAEGTVNFKHVDKGDKGTAAVWNTGALLTGLANGDKGTITFNGVTINIEAEKGATTGATVAGDKLSINIKIDTDTIVSAADQAEKIAELLNTKTTKEGTALENFSFAYDTGAITITDLTEADTGIATNGKNNNTLIIGTTGAVKIANNTNAEQLTTVGVDAVNAKYTFDITNGFKVNETIQIGDFTFKGVTGEANALLGEFSIDGNKAEQAASLKTAIEANTALHNRYEVNVEDAKLTLLEKVAGQEEVGKALTAPTTRLTAATAGVYSFEAQMVKVGEAYNIDGVEINAVDDAVKYRDDIAAGKAILIADNINDQAENLRRAINANDTLSAKYEATGTGANIQLTQQEGAESSTGPTVTVGKKGAEGRFIANFQIGANTGQSMTVEVDDMRSIALKVSGEESATSVIAKNGTAATYVSAANVSNGTDNVSVEYALDVSDHTKATNAISVINDAIETVSAQRSQLGAFQNRLEHTINNLGTSAENLTAAESRIRDVDMAEEIMEFTKMNILSQAAQAMLAQANMQPQSVLQLLG